MTTATLGIDPAKSVFALHGADAAGKPVLARPNVSRAALSAPIAGLPPCLIDMEACSVAHHGRGCSSSTGTRCACQIS